MAYFTHIKDETKPHNKIVEVVPNGIRLVDFLKKQELVNPQIFLNGNLLFSEDGEVLIDIDDNYRLKEDDNLLVINTLKGVIAASTIFYVFAASIVVSYAISALLAPDKPSIPKLSDQQKGESEYSISTSQNMAKKGEPIPECFGEFVRYPDLISAPYYRYHNNEEYLYMLMCITKGKTRAYNSYETTSAGAGLFVEDTDVRKFPLGVIASTEGARLDFTDPAASDNYLSPLNFNWENTLLNNLINKTYSEVKNISVNSENQESLKFGINGSGTSEIRRYKFIVTFGSSLTTESIGKYNYVLKLHKSYLGTDILFNFSPQEGLIQENSSIELFFTDTNYPVTQPETRYDLDETRFSFFYNGSYDIPISNIKLVKYDYAIDTDIIPDENMHDIVITAKEVENFELTTDPTSKMNDIRLNDFATEIKRIEVDIALNGLYTQGSGSELNNRTVEFKVVYTGSDGLEVVNNESITDNTRDIIRKTYSYNVPRDNYTVRVERVTAESTDTRIQDTITLTRIKGYVDTLTYSGTLPTNLKSQINYEATKLSYLPVRLKATSGLSGKGQFKIKYKGERFTTTGLITPISTIEDVLNYIYTTENGGRQDPQNLDLPSMPESFNHVFEKRGTVYQAMNTVARSGNYNLYPSFNSITAKKDEAQPIPAFMFNESNIIKGTLKISKTVRAETDYDGMKGIYKDADTFEEKTIVFPETAIFPQELPLDGVTDDAIALERIKFAWYQGIYRNTKYEFDTTLVGHIPSLFSRCQIAHNSISNSIPNQLIGYTANTVTLRDTIKTDGTYTHIVFRDRQGAPSALFEILSINENVLTLDVSTQSLPVADFYIGDDEIKTMCQVGTSATFIKDIMLTEIKPKRGNKISIKAFNYDERVYQ